MKYFLKVRPLMYLMDITALESGGTQIISSTSPLLCSNLLSPQTLIFTHAIAHPLLESVMLVYPKVRPWALYMLIILNIYSRIAILSFADDLVVHHAHFQVSTTTLQIWVGYSPSGFYEPGWYKHVTTKAPASSLIVLEFIVPPMGIVMLSRSAKPDENSRIE